MARLLDSPADKLNVRQICLSVYLTTRHAEMWRNLAFAALVFSFHESEYFERVLYRNFPFLTVQIISGLCGRFPITVYNRLISERHLERIIQNDELLLTFSDGTITPSRIGQSDASVQPHGTISGDWLQSLDWREQIQLLGQHGRRFSARRPHVRSQATFGDESLSNPTDWNKVICGIHINSCSLRVLCVHPDGIAVDYVPNDRRSEEERVGTPYCDDKIATMSNSAISASPAQP